VVSRAVLEAFRNELAPFRVSGTTIHFTAGTPLPAKLVGTIVAARVKENEGRKKYAQKSFGPACRNPAAGGGPPGRVVRGFSASPRTVLPVPSGYGAGKSCPPGRVPR
jgi:hypothetical protein